MARNYDNIDLKFSWNGDFLIGDNGDLADTTDDQIESFIQELRTVVASESGDWLLHPTLGAGLSDFIGEANIKENARKLEDRIRSSLVINNIVQDDDLSVRTIPVGNHSLLAILNIQVIATTNNSLDVNGITVKLLFDYNERGVFFLE